jgi:hypothetical protein
VALATHIRADYCDHVDEIPEQDVLAQVEEHGWIVYDSPNRESRHEIDLEQYPVFNEDGQENRVYNQHGMRIPRVEYSNEEEPLRHAGVLVDLREIAYKFDGQEGDRNITLYPQAYLHSVGHVKAHGVITPFRELIEDYNDVISELWEEEDENDTSMKAITPVSCQFYNELSHRVARRSGTQEVQKGEQTAAMASGYPHFTGPVRSRAQRLFERCQQMLPFERHELLLAEQLGTTPTDLRAENVFLIDMHAFPPDHRTGR